MKKIYTFISALVISSTLCGQEGKLAKTITDNEGNSYKTVNIGTQYWMAENLKVSKYNDGTSIPNVTDSIQWSNLTTGAWAYLNNDAANDKYGNLYNWYALSPTTNGNKNVCPVGWHVPTETDWRVLIDLLGGDKVAGGKMKEVGTKNWISPNTEATNSSLFTGLSVGFRSFDGGFGEIGTNCAWWGASENNSTDGWVHGMDTWDGSFGTEIGKKQLGLSVRCLKD